LLKLTAWSQQIQRYPKQNPYSTIGAEIAAQRHALGASPPALARLMARSDALLGRVSHPREALADAVTVKQLSAIQVRFTALWVENERF
jgi:hypothetical protein